MTEHYPTTAPGRGSVRSGCGGCENTEAYSFTFTRVHLAHAVTLGITTTGTLPLCDDCRYKLGADQWGDPRVALADALDLIEDLREYGRRPEDYPTAHAVHLDARAYEMRRRTEHITGYEDVRS